MLLVIGIVNNNENNKATIVIILERLIWVVFFFPILYTDFAKPIEVQPKIKTIVVMGKHRGLLPYNPVNYDPFEDESIIVTKLSSIYR